MTMKCSGTGRGCKVSFERLSQACAHPLIRGRSRRPGETLPAVSRSSQESPLAAAVTLPAGKRERETQRMAISDGTPTQVRINLITAHGRASSRRMTPSWQRRSGHKNSCAGIIKHHDDTDDGKRRSPTASKNRSDGCRGGGRPRGRAGTGVEARHHRMTTTPINTVANTMINAKGSRTTPSGSRWSSKSRTTPPPTAGRLARTSAPISVYWPP